MGLSTGLGLYNGVGLGLSNGMGGRSMDELSDHWSSSQQESDWSARYVTPLSSS